VILHLDPTHCDGFGICAQILPEVITLDEWGFPVLGEAQPGPSGFESDRRAVDVPPALVRLAHRAVISCPRLALHLDE